MILFVDDSSNSVLKILSIKSNNFSISKWEVEKEREIHLEFTIYKELKLNEMNWNTWLHVCFCVFFALASFFVLLLLLRSRVDEFSWNISIRFFCCTFCVRVRVSLMTKEKWMSKSKRENYNNQCGNSEMNKRIQVEQEAICKILYNLLSIVHRSHWTQIFDLHTFEMVWKWMTATLLLMMARKKTEEQIPKTHNNNNNGTRLQRRTQIRISQCWRESARVHRIESKKCVRKRVFVHQHQHWTGNIVNGKLIKIKIG